MSTTTTTTSPRVGFHLIVASNGSLNLYPDNLCNLFANQLPEPYDLHGEWECALTEIYYPSDVDVKRTISLEKEAQDARKAATAAAQAATGLEALAARVTRSSSDGESGEMQGDQPYQSGSGIKRRRKRDDAPLSYSYNY